MKVIMNDSRIDNITQLQDFLKATKKIQLSLKYESIEEKYKFITKIVKKFKYLTLTRKDKRIVLSYLKKITGYKRSQLMHLVTRACIGELGRKEYNRKNPNKKYLLYDVKLLEYTDEVHLRLNSIATKEILRREYEVFGNKNYSKIAQVSASHINNLRKSEGYRFYWTNHTKARQTDIGKTKKPDTQGRPGSIRVDTVHQKDIYHINAVDEVTQWEVVVCVPQISEYFMKQAVKEILSQYPFVVYGFHSDRGGEFINYTVAEMLNRYLINQTKSRARKSNDNALVECKNGHVLRKNFGWSFITRDQEIVGLINEFYKEYFNPYLNYHRPCLYPRSEIDGKGKIKKIYDKVSVPYEELKSVCKRNKKIYLKTGISFRKLDKIAYSKSDNEFAYEMRRKKLELEKIINQRNTKNF